MGEYFGEEDEYNQKVLEAFVDLFNFENMELADAMRMIFKTFDMPGEAQKIERIVYKIGSKYGEDNPDSFDGDAAGVLAFSIVMLHTNLYSANVQADMKMKMKDFVHMAKGIKCSRNPFDDKYLQDVYNSVKKKPIA